MRRGNAHERLRLLAGFIFLAIAAPIIAQMLPLFLFQHTVERVSGIRPLTPLELVGQSIYIRENCQACHSRQVRTLPHDVDRYGHYSLAAENLYEHPAQWGDRRLAADLSRLGHRYSDVWLVEYLHRPRDLSGANIMPSYGYLSGRTVDVAGVAAHLRAQRLLGVPYNESMIEAAAADLRAQLGEGDAEALLRRYGANVKIRDFGGDGQRISEMDALIAYLQVFGELVNFEEYRERR